MDVVCGHCATRTAINAPTEEQLEEGLEWLCECGEMNSIGGPG